MEASVANKARIVPTADGAYMISGDFEIAWPSGRTLKSRSVVYLCRCGLSKDKPFCDMSHKNGFSSREGDETAHRETGPIAAAS